MKWEEDLTKDVKFHDERDDIDHPFSGVCSPVEFSLCNQQHLIQSFLEIKDSCKTIVEIGVHRNGDQSSTWCFLNKKNKDTLYLGVDVEDKTFLDNAENNIHTLKANSSNYQEVVTTLSNLGCSSIDYLFIDGWHSINQVYADWEFTNLLSPEGVVGFHDVTNHPGPHAFINNLNPEKWETSIWCKEDNGIGFAKRI